MYTLVSWLRSLHFRGTRKNRVSQKKTGKHRKFRSLDAKMVHERKIFLFFLQTLVCHDVCVTHTHRARSLYASVHTCCTCTHTSDDVVSECDVVCHLVSENGLALKYPESGREQRVMTRVSRRVVTHTHRARSLYASVHTCTHEKNASLSVTRPSGSQVGSEHEFFVKTRNTRP